MALLTGKETYRQRAERILKLLKSAMMRSPSAFGHLLCALDTFLASPFEIAIVGSLEAAETQALIAEAFNRYLPNKVVALAQSDADRAAQTIKLLEHRQQIQGQPTAYVCRNFYCQAPVIDNQKLAEQLES